MNSFFNSVRYKKYLKNFSNNKNFKKKIDVDTFGSILNFIDKILEGKEKAKILMLSLSGSRVGGWERDTSDYDIYGIFARKNYWNRVSVRRNGFDITLYELDYIFVYLPRYVSFNFFQNILAYPIYIDPEFDYKGLSTFCNANLCHLPVGSVDGLSPKGILHIYSQYLAMIYFLKNRKFSWDVFKINRRYYNFKILSILREKHLSHPDNFGGVTKGELAIIKRDLRKLKQDIKILKNKFKNEQIDADKLREWEEKAKKLYWED